MLIQDPLPHKVLRRRPVLDLLLQTIRTHVLLEFALAANEGWSGGGGGEDVSCFYICLLY